MDVKVVGYEDVTGAVEDSSDAAPGEASVADEADADAVVAADVGAA